MKKQDVVNAILEKKWKSISTNESAQAFAPVNIALCKYWGKRDIELNLPMTSSLSISLGKKGTLTEIKISKQGQDKITLNHQLVDLNSSFSKKLIEFINLFRFQKSLYFHIHTQTTIPVAAGLASSSSGFAAIIMALDKLFNWKLDSRELSILARLGSGSACRSICSGFVEWQAGEQADGMDSYGKQMSEIWPDLCIGLLLISDQEKKVSSREAMQRTLNTSPFYSLWSQKVDQDLALIKQAIKTKDIRSLGETAESNALAMHALMLSSWPPICYFLPETLLFIQKIWELRNQDLPLYFTQDAGPNLKLIFLKQNLSEVLIHFPSLEVIYPFESNYKI